MEFHVREDMAAQAVVVSNQFIDTCMAAANGEYVKVFLYLLRHANDAVQPGISDIADALNHTDADVRRAVAYWEKVGVLTREPEETGASKEAGANRKPETERGPRANRESGVVREAGANRESDASGTEEVGETEAAEESGAAGESGTDRSLDGAADRTAAYGGAPEMTAITAVDPAGNPDGAGRAIGGSGPELTEEIPAINRGEELERLSSNEEFTALLYALQRFLGKTFTQVDCEMFAYLYGGLSMSHELLEYLAQYCRECGHTNRRYMEKVALNWHARGIRTIDEAKLYVQNYSSDITAIRKAFGISGRVLADVELKFVERWFKEYGFDQKLILEACARTIRATGAASFPYADKILAEWKKKGVRKADDLTAIDQERKRNAQTGRPGGNAGGNPVSGTSGRPAAGGAGASGSAGSGGRRTPANRFKNFEERTNHYEDQVWANIRNRKREEDKPDGAQ